MENIVLKLSSETEVEDEKFSHPLAYVFEENIGLKDLCVSFKINVPAMNDVERRMMTTYLIRYMNEYAEVQMYTNGLHENGKKAIPHIHIHFIIKHTLEWGHIMTNASQHRKRWFDKCQIKFPKGKKVIEMYSQPVDPLQPKWHFLAYPMKEGKYFKNSSFFSFLNEPMSQNMIDFLVTYAKKLYDQKVAHDLAADRSEERKEIKYSEIVKIARDFPGGSFRDFQIYMEVEYIDKLRDSGDSIPDIDNYKKNLKRAAVHLKYFKTYEL